MSYLTVSNPITGQTESVPFDEFIPKNKKEKMQDTFAWDQKLLKKAIAESKRRKR